MCFKDFTGGPEIEDQMNERKEKFQMFSPGCLNAQKTLRRTFGVRKKIWLNLQPCSKFRGGVQNVVQPNHNSELQE